MIYCRPKTYFIVIMQLLFSLTAPVFANNIDLAYLTSLNETVSDSINNKEYNGWWESYLEADEGFTAELNAKLNTGSITMELYDSFGNRLRTTHNPFSNSKNAYYINNGESATLDRVVEVSGIYYIRVKSQGKTSGNYSLTLHPDWFNYETCYQ